MLATPLFGSDFETAVSRDVYLPDGEWIDYETGEKFYGPTTLQAYSLSENKIPIFIGGKGVVVSKSSQKSENLNVEIFPIAKDGSAYTYTYTDGITTSVRSPITTGDGILKQC
jgi:alpha-glucosidase (family GH31 glycosyl hydrolase)